MLKPRPLTSYSAPRISQARAGEQLAMKMPAEIPNHASAPRPLFTTRLFTTRLFTTRLFTTRLSIKRLFEAGRHLASPAAASTARGRKTPGAAPRRGSVRDERTAARRSGHGFAVPRRASKAESPIAGSEWDAVAAIRRATAGAIEVMAIMFAFVVFGLGWAVLADAAETPLEQAPSPRRLSIASIASISIASVAGASEETRQVAASAPSRYSSAAFGAIERQPNCQVEIIPHASSQPSGPQQAGQRLEAGGCH